MCIRDSTCAVCTTVPKNLVKNYYGFAVFRDIVTVVLYHLDEQGAPMTRMWLASVAVLTFVYEALFMRQMFEIRVGILRSSHAVFRHIGDALAQWFAIWTLVLTLVCIAYWPLYIGSVIVDCALFAPKITFFQWTTTANLGPETRAHLPRIGFVVNVLCISLAVHLQADVLTRPTHTIKDNLYALVHGVVVFIYMNRRLFLNWRPVPPTLAIRPGRVLSKADFSK